MLLTWKWTLETIPLNNERLSLVKTKLPIKISTPIITNSHKIIRSEIQILLGSWKKMVYVYRKFIHIFPSDILSVTFFRLLLTIKRYYKNRWSFWPRGGRIPTPVICRVPPGFLDSNFDQVITRGKGEGGESYQSFMLGDSALRSNPWPFYIPFLKEKGPFRLPSIDKCYPFPPKSLNPF